MTFAPCGMRAGQRRRIARAAASSSSTSRTASTVPADRDRGPARPPRARCAATRRSDSPRAGSAARRRPAPTPARAAVCARWRPATVSTAPFSTTSPQPVQRNDHLVDGLEPARGRAGLRHAARLGRVIAGWGTSRCVGAHRVPQPATCAHARASGGRDVRARRDGVDGTGRLRRVDGGHARARARRGPAERGRPVRGAHLGCRAHLGGRRGELRHGGAARLARPGRGRRGLGDTRRSCSPTSAPAPASCAAFPGVSYVAGDDGHQVGPAAAMSGQRGGEVVLKPGAAAAAQLQMVNVANFDAAVCNPTPVRGLRVYPPGDTTSLYVERAGTGCASTPPATSSACRPCSPPDPSHGESAVPRR